MGEFIVPIVTPFENGKLSVEKLQTHAKSLLSNGVDYIFLCGSTGLGPSLTLSERLSMLRALEDISENVIIQVGGLNLDESLTIAAEAAKMKVYAIAALPPYYYPRIPIDWIVNYFKLISEKYRTIIYNFPQATGYDLNLDTVKKIINSGADIIGIKETISDISHMLEIKWGIGNDFKVYTGPDNLIMSGLRSGLDGLVAGSGNYIPRIIRTIVDNYSNDTGVRGQKVVNAITSVAKRYGQWSANYSLVKIIQKYDVGEPRPPIFPLDSESYNKLSREVNSILPDGDKV